MSRPDGEPGGKRGGDSGRDPARAPSPHVVALLLGVGAGLTVVFVAALVLVSAVLPRLVRDQINVTIARNDRYSGGVTDVSVDLLDAALRIRGLHLLATDDQAPVRELRAEEVVADLRLLASVWRTAAVGTVTVVGPDLRVEPPAVTSAAAEETSIRDLLLGLPDFDLDLVLRGGRVRLDHPTTGALTLEPVTGEVTSLTNLPRRPPVEATVSAALSGGGALDAHVVLDPLQEPLAAHGQVNAVDVWLPQLDDLWRQQAGFGVEDGTLDLHLRAAYRPRPGAAAEPLVYGGVDLRSVDAELRVSIEGVTPSGTDLARSVRLPHGELSASWHPDEMDRIELQGRLTDPSAELTRSGAAAQLAEDGGAGEAVQPSPLLDLPPFVLTELTVEGGRVALVDATVEPRVDLVASGLDLSLTGLSNQPAAELAKLVVDGDLAGGALHVDARFDPVAELPRLTVDARIEELPLERIQDLLRAYADLDASRGRLSVYTEAATEQNAFQGYVKVLVDEAEIFTSRDWKEGLGAIWEGLVGAGAEILENQPLSRTAARLPLEGKFGQPDPDVSQALLSLLRNAFVQALMPGLRRSIDLGEVPPG